MSMIDGGRVIQSVTNLLLVILANRNTSYLTDRCEGRQPPRLIASTSSVLATSFLTPPRLLLPSDACLSTILLPALPLPSSSSFALSAIHIAVTAAAKVDHRVPPFPRLVAMLPPVEVISHVLFTLHCHGWFLMTAAITVQAPTIAAATASGASGVRDFSLPVAAEGPDGIDFARHMIHAIGSLVRQITSLGATGRATEES